MMRASQRREAVAVLDVGKTNVKLLAIAQGEVLTSRCAPNVVRGGPPYPHCDVDHLWRWLQAALADLAEAFVIRALVPTAHGSAAALIDHAGLVLPVLDYEAEPPPETAAAYAEVAPWFEECCCPILPAGLTLGRQLFWQRRAHPEAFARARWILPLPQYWAWRLSGVPACEVTSLGAQTQLWDPRARTFSSLARREGWTELFPPMRRAWDVLGPLRLDLARRCGVAAEIPVLCGIHDSNANFARYLAAGLHDFTLISTGTWLITFAPGRSLDDLDPLRDTVANCNLLGRPVACARFMGGREYAAIADEEGLRATPTLADAARLVRRGTMALPSFTDAGGPFPGTGGRGRIVGPPPVTAAERAALASLYVALMASVELDLLASTSRVIIDGSFADNRLFAALLAALRPAQEVAVSVERDGTALGAALLWRWTERDEPVALHLQDIPSTNIAGLDEYALGWLEAVSGVSASAAGSGPRRPESPLQPTPAAR